MSINLYKFYAGCLYISHVLTRFPTDTLCIILVLLLVHSMFNCCVVLLYCEDYNWAVSKKTKQKTNQEIYLYILHMMLKWIFNVFERRVLKIKVLFMLNVCRCVLWHASVDTFHFFCVSMLQKPAYAYQLPSFFLGPVLNLSNISPSFYDFLRPFWSLRCALEYGPIVYPF